MESADPTSPMPRLLVAIVAYEAENHIESVLARIPSDLGECFETRVLVSDDSSTDRTLDKAAQMLERSHLPYDWVVLSTGRNLGYGGNQKVVYQYAVDNEFDVVVLVHGDGQYPPERIGELATLALRSGAAFGSRMSTFSALAGGMPRYKYVGNRILTTIQNRLLGTDLTEFHSGFRSYTTAALRRVPFRLNSDDFHFDTEIFIQLLKAGVTIGELAIPTHYGDEVCRVDGLRYGRSVVQQSLHAALQQRGMFYERKFDIGDPADRYESKITFRSPPAVILERIPAAARVADFGSAGGHLAGALRRRGCHVVGFDVTEPPDPANFDEFRVADLDDGVPAIDGPVDDVVLADVIEHLQRPEDFVDGLVELCRRSDVRRVHVSTGNVAFVVTRLMLLVGQFNYGPRGILDMTHTRLFTRRSIVRLFEQAGFRVERVDGLPVPFPLAVGDGPLARVLLRVNDVLIRLAGGLFSFQWLLLLSPPPEPAPVSARAWRRERPEPAVPSGAGR